MIKPTRHPHGYKKLLVYKKAEELQKETSNFTSLFPPLKTLFSLADQMNRSARSTKQNIVEGWKRNSTREYYEFLGYSIASNAELEEDYNDIIKGIYKELAGRMGEIKEEEIEKLPFYPLDAHLPHLVQLKLRAKELNFLLDRLQKSLVEKMKREITLSVSDRAAINRNQIEEANRWYENMLEENGLMRLENGRVVKREEWEKRDKREGEKKEWEKRDKRDEREGEKKE